MNKWRIAVSTTENYPHDVVWEIEATDQEDALSIAWNRCESTGDREWWQGVYDIDYYGGKPWK